MAIEEERHAAAPNLPPAGAEAEAEAEEEAQLLTLLEAYATDTRATQAAPPDAAAAAAAAAEEEAEEVQWASGLAAQVALPLSALLGAPLVNSPAGALAIVVGRPPRRPRPVLPKLTRLGTVPFAA